MRIVVVVVIVLAVGLAVLLLGRQPTPIAAHTMTSSILASKQFDVGRQDIRLVDNSRATQANNEFVGSDQRVLQTSFWFPLNEQGSVAAGKHPLIVYSHGLSSSRLNGRHIIEFLASNGYVVIAADFPLTHKKAPGGQKVKDVVNQPRDLSFLIDTVLSWSADEQHVLYNHVDDTRIGATGISLGGFTSTLAAYHPVWRDSRIKAVASIAGPSQSLSPLFYSHAEIPFLMLAGDIDAIVPYGAHALPILERVPDASLVTIKDGTHLGFAGNTGILRWLNNADSIGCRALLKRIDTKEEPWHDLLGTVEQGISREPVTLPCQTMPLPKGMNPLHQQLLTKTVVYSFFESQFAEGVDTRQKYDRYLHKLLPNESTNISVQRSRSYKLSRF